MAKVLQVRDVPDDVHDALRRAAHTRGLSLTRYVLEELEHVARRDQLVQDNLAVIRATQGRVRGHVDRQAVLAALADGRNE